MKFAVGFFLLLFFSSCHNKFDNKALKIFKYNESSGINTLDPIFAKDQATIWVANQVFNGLVQLDNNLNVIPSIAKNWVVSRGGLCYTFILRDDVFFHDHKLFKQGKGRRVIASDFEYSFNRLINPDVAAPGAWVLSNVDSFYAINDTTFEINLIKPFSAFLSLLSMQYCSVVPSEIIKHVDFNRNPVGTGPFKFQLWKDGVKLVLRRNSNYFEKEHGEQLPYLDAVSITFIQDKQSAFLKFIQGELDFISGIHASYKDEILTSDGNLKDKYQDQIVLQKSSYLNTEYLGFLNDSIPLEVRRAINFGFDKKKMLKHLRNNIGTPALNGFIPKGLPSFSNNVSGYDYNPVEARRLLEKSTFNLDDKIILSTTASYIDLCEYIQHELLQIGLKIVLDINPSATHRQMVATSKLLFFRGSWIADYPDSENYFALFYSKNYCPHGPNYTHFSNHLFDRLYELSLSELDDSLRYNYYQKMDQIIVDNAPVVPLYYDQVLRFTHNNIKGLGINAMNLLDLKRVKK